jgi:hypothetical protein
VAWVVVFVEMLTCRTKHKDHWKPFDRKNPPKFMKCGEIGIDDKREYPRPV